MRKTLGTRGEAMSAAKHEAGGYFGEMKEVTPLYSDKPANGNVGYRPMRNAKSPDGSPLYTREYWFRNSDGQIVVIQDHSAGHVGITNGEYKHLNVRHIPENAVGSEAAILDALDGGAPPPGVPAIGHYDFGVVD